MSFEAVRKAVEVRFGTQWGATTVVQYKNVPFAQPTTEWARITVRHGGGVQGSIGSTRLDRQFGIVFVEIFTPKNTGSKRAMDLADTAAAVFRYVTVTEGTTTIKFRHAEISDSEETHFYHVTVKIPFEAEAYF